MVRLLLFCSALSMLLMACEKPDPEVVEKAYPVGVYVPEDLRGCPGIPKSYDYVKATPDAAAWQSEVSAYVASLHETARTCKTNLDAVDDILDDHEKTLATPR